jgi:hypothetical protein
MRKNKRKGIWIPDSILKLNLSGSDKILLSEIYSLCTREKGCYASNKHFANKIYKIKKYNNMSIRKLNTNSCLDEVIDQYNRNKSSYVNQEYLELMDHETRKEKAYINYHWYTMIKEIDQIDIETKLLILEAFTFGYIFEKYNNLNKCKEKMIIEKIQNYISFSVA